ncbi:S-adenosyl-L-methionine-dependent methyltransferase [Microdochium bolleyi]|uniref:S-adenosyl-L-methionine-dependent methyltransferase n=1 Tax=Microdochium bolleyi TaxID=196109 RepID=A0A136IJF1_9PEZI|nr:S-adenosyl-L-methionine-dependent methyltransferase [Microdochium bolleyi]
MRSSCQFDEWCVSFVKANPQSTVLHIACGLDSRINRISTRLPKELQWIEVDRPEIMNLRKKLDLADGPHQVGYRLLEGDVTNLKWLKNVPSVRPTLIIMEGLLMYLQPEHGKHLIKQLVDRFPRGQVVCDHMGTLMCLFSSWNWISMFKERRVKFQWGLTDPTAVAQLDVKLRLLTSIPYPILPPWFGYWKSKVLFAIPLVRNNMG